MPSEYDALLEAPPTQQKSDYDALLAPAQQPQQGGFFSGIAAGIGRAINPINLVKGALDIGGESDISKIRRYSSALSEIATGKPIHESLEKNIPEVAQQQDVLLGKYGGREQAAEIAGLGIQTALLAIPFVKGKGIIKPSLRDVALGKEPSEMPLTSAAEEVTKNASKITGAEGVTQPEVRPRVGEETPLRQQGETPQARQEGTQVISPSTEAAAVSGTEMPPAAVAQIPEGAKVNVKLRTPTGEMREAIGMDAKEAEGIFTKEKSSYQALLDCLGA